MKINEYPQEIQDKCNIACLVCREQFKIEHPNITNVSCSCKAILNEYCPTLEKILNTEMEK